ncbi:patatin-like phospholipase domain containing 3 [Takifugu rubripes]|uniref:triacylglycerol lipase n=1 Tax=Takifugu rubripes TaxID=31033 RepID=H2TIB8_TAKRU|nr:patatin-like phospholipase domain-containing protein 2 [Takifugu rubripes]|eukprot:XP_003972682.1 PREDICTED: patatin-like phospholipase domain-containing protein 2 [Takifugu rubripes]
MFDLKGGWNLSFAGCGFLGIYHIGVASCLLEKAPYLVKGATRLYGASAGALTASVLASQAALTKCCEDVIEVAKEARKRNLGPLHPSFNLVKVLKTGLNRDLPSDAHILASGRLCVSLTRVSDGENVLVSDFSSKEELIQALVCSCFIPIYCGLIPPAFRGVRYVDGGISDNLPQSELKNTITISPFSGESDICPRDSSTSFHELRFTNTSIQINLGNMYRLSQALFPPEPKVLAEMCQSGYKDALRFLQENNLLMLERPTSGPPPLQENLHTCCKYTETTREWLLRRLRLLGKQHWWMDEQIILPTPIKKVFCEACQDNSGLYDKVSQMLPVRVASYMLLPYTLPVQSAYSVAQRFLEWIPEVPDDVSWLFGVAGDVYRQAWRGSAAGSLSEPCLRKCLSAPPLPLEGDGPLQSDHLPALSSLDLHSSYWQIPKSTSPASQHHPLRVSSPPQQVCFFVGLQDETDRPEGQ